MRTRFVIAVAVLLIGLMIRLSAPPPGALGQFDQRSLGSVLMVIGFFGGLVAAIRWARENDKH